MITTLKSFTLTFRDSLGYLFCLFNVSVGDGRVWGAGLSKFLPEITIYKALSLKKSKRNKINEREDDSHKERGQRKNT